jgi:hypothetical protein
MAVRPEPIIPASPRPHGEVDVAHPCRRQAAQRDQRLPEIGRAGAMTAHDAGEFPSRDQGVERVVSERRDGAGGDDRAVAQHGHAVRDGADLLHPMRYVDDGAAGRLQLPDHREKRVLLGGGQAGCRLIEGDDAAAARQGAADLHKLAIGHAQGRDPRFNLQMRRKISQKGRGLVPICAARHQPDAARLAQEDILRHIELRHEAQLLAHHADPHRQGLARAIDPDGAELFQFDHPGGRLQGHRT